MPILGSEHISVEGQELTPLSDYSISGFIVTLVNPPFPNLSDIDGKGAPRANYRIN
jgi:hypothetical protein